MKWEMEVEKDSDIGLGGEVGGGGGAALGGGEVQSR